MMKKIIAAAIGNCVHVAGAINFLKLAEKEGYETEFLGAAVSINQLINIVIERKPDIVGISYRLAPSAAKPLFAELEKAIKSNGLSPAFSKENEPSPERTAIRWVFGGTEPVAAVAREYDFFEEVFDGTKGDDYTIDFLRGRQYIKKSSKFEGGIVSRIASKYPYPVIRHHFGLSSLEDTIDGIAKIAESGVLDVISIAPDQNAQQYFFNMEKADKSMDGAGGVPVRTYEDFNKIYEASLSGNRPLLRCYSGTSDVFRFARMLIDTIKNAWCAVPLCWYNVLDGRGLRGLIESIDENQRLMKWHGDRGIPVEVNEAHHWSLRDAHDVIGVASAFLAAYNAKKMGVKNYIAQYMLNVPKTMSPKMDLAKMLAKIELIESLEDQDFKVYRQVRAGLASFPTNLFEAKGQLSASTYLGMALKPHIIHVVGYCEAHHAATPTDVIESCSIVHGVIQNCLKGLPDMAQNSEVISRKNQLKEEAAYLLDSIKSIQPYSNDPLIDPAVIARAIKMGLLDAPHLKGNRHGCGKLVTKMVDGACYAYDDKNNSVMSEKDRISQILCK